MENIKQKITAQSSPEKSDQYHCKVLIYVQAKSPPRRHSAIHLNIHLYRYNVNAFWRHPVHCRLITQLSMLFRKSLNKSVHIKIAANFYFLTWSTVLEQTLGSTMMKCRLHWYITSAQARRRTAQTLPRFINRMWCIRENLVWFLHVYTKERFYQPPFLAQRRISSLHHYTLHEAKKISGKGRGGGGIKTEITLSTGYLCYPSFGKAAGLPLYISTTTWTYILINITQLLAHAAVYRGADKSLARQGSKRARKHVRDVGDFNSI